jgi:hypothetical protein
MAANDTAQTSIPRSSSWRRTWRRAAPLAALAALGLGLAACGGGSPKASSGSTGSTGFSGSSKPSEAQALKYAGCMRSHGIANFPDPTVGTNGMPQFSINSSGNSDLDPHSPQFQAAQKVCRKYLPGLGVQTPAEKAAADAKALEYAKCMRSHGEPTFPDPNGQGLIKITGTGILNPTSPQFQRAQQACQILDTGFEEQVRSVARAPGGPSSAGSGSPNAGSGS